MAREAGKTRLALITHAGMDDTRAFYHHLGWTETGREGVAVFLELTL